MVVPNSLKSLGFQEIRKKNRQPLNLQKEILMEKFKKIQNLNNISAVLKLYTKIPLGKAAKALNTTVENLKEMLELYKKRNEATFKNTPFESTIIKRFVRATRQLDFKIEHESDIVDERAKPGLFEGFRQGYPENRWDEEGLGMLLRRELKSEKNIEISKNSYLSI